MAKALSTAWLPGAASAVPAVAVLVLGATVLAGWLLGQPALLMRIPPGSRAMVAASAIGFTVAGATLLACLGAGPAARKARYVGCVLLMSLSGLAMLGHAGNTTSPVDFPALHRALVPEPAFPGRMSMPTAIAFLLAGFLAATYERVRSRLQAVAVQGLAGVLIAIGTVSLVGWNLAPEALVPGYRFGWMPVPTAAAFLAIGIALLALIANAPWYHEVYRRREDEKILILTLAILVLMALAMSTAGFTLIQRVLEQGSRDALLQAARAQASQLERVSDTVSIEALERMLVRDPAARPPVAWTLCVHSESGVECRPGDTPPTLRALALAGEPGVGRSHDASGAPVLAAHVPLFGGAAGVLAASEAEDVYAPLRDDFGLWARWFGALALLGALLVSSQVRPVALRVLASERALRELYASLGDGIMVLRPDGVIDFTNPAADRIFGYGAGELAGRPVSILIPEELREANARATARVLAGQSSSLSGRRELVFPALRRDGTRFEIEFSLAPMRQEGEPRLVAVVRDVSERQALARMKSEFVAKVSHELRTPLTSILGALGLLRDGDAGELAPATRNFVDMAWRNAERLAVLVDDVIDTERIESGSLAFRDMEFELRPFVVEAVELNQPYAAREEAFIYLEEPVPAAWIRGDRDRLMQVMANLLSNAAKFSPAGEEIRVRAERRDGRVRVCVVDKGGGIPEEFQPRVFEKFAQADASDTREAGGTGLGLAICKSIVERLGGTIGFDSRRGDGATFWFELPASGPGT